MGYRLCSQSSGENLETVTEAGIIREMLLPGLLCLLSSEPRDYLPRAAVPTMRWVLLHHSSVKGMPPLQCNLMEPGPVPSE